MRKRLALVSVSAALFGFGCAGAGVGFEMDMGGPAGFQTGRGRQPIEHAQTEAITPGVASALFPDPGW